MRHKAKRIGLQVNIELTIQLYLIERDAALLTITTRRSTPNTFQA